VNALLNSLTDQERALIRETEPAQVTDLDEDGLVALHARIRRARDKYVKLYRREASAKVAEVGGRGKARPRNTRNSQKAEVFEDALARVSRHLAAAARRSATELKSERLAAVKRERNTAPPRPSRRPQSTQAKSQRPARTPSSAPAVRKRQASTLATGARRQARRDSRSS
jgi:hypothetical protein